MFSAPDPTDRTNSQAGVDDEYCVSFCNPDWTVG